MNIYEDILTKSLPRLLNMFQLNPVSPALGIADRQFAGWKTTDFVNATFQGGVYSLSIAAGMGHLEQKIANRVFENCIDALPKITNKNGSVNEAYPNESSFCVTALVIHDLLSAYEVLPAEFTKSVKERLFAGLRPLVSFITKNGEEHAIISNHLATAYAALLLWHKHTGEGLKRAEDILQIILDHQSKEGWFLEYEGADPGYQTLCLYYLAKGQAVRHNPALQESIDQSLLFLQHCMHPDGSLGGLYGSRNTKVYYPGGLSFLAERSPIASAIVSNFESHNHSGVHILPSAIDAGNYVPLLNSYAFAASLANPQDRTSSALPCHQPFTKSFPDAGLHITSTERYYAIANLKKGGTLMVFDKSAKKLVLESGGVWGNLENKRTFSAQTYDNKVDWKALSAESVFYAVNDEQPTAFKFFVLRFLALTIFRSVFLGNLFKKMVVRRLMTGKKSVGGMSKRTLTFSDQNITVRDEIVAPRNCVEIHVKDAFRSIHMASSGYNTSHTFRLTEVPEWIKFDTHAS